MNCEEVKISMHDFIDELLDGLLKRDIETHIRTCDQCFNEYKRIKKFFDKLKNLPYTIEPPKEIIETFSAELLSRSLKDDLPESAQPAVNLRKLKKEQEEQEKQLKKARGAVRKSLVFRTMMISRVRHSLPFNGINWGKVLLILFPLVLIAAGYFIYDFQKNNSPWKVITNQGTIAINGFVNHTGKIAQGESLFTENNSKASIHIPKIGNVEVNENSLIVLKKAKDGDNIIILRQGSINVTNTSNMPDFSIELKNYIVIDRGGEFSISIDEDSNIKIFVRFGFAEINNGEETIYLDEGYICEIRTGVGIGSPYRDDASEQLKEEIKNFDYQNGGEKSLNKIVELATEKDMLTLLALIPNSSQMGRQILFQAITNKFPPPESVTRMGIIKSDSQMLYLWWQEIEWQL